MRRPTTLLTTLASLLTLSLAGCIDEGTPDPAEDAGSTGASDSDSDDSPETTSPSTTDPEPGTTGIPDPDTGESDPDTGDTGEPETTGEEPTVEEQLVGHWVSAECEPMPQADGSTLYFLRDFTLELGSWSITGTIFGDEACTFPLLTLDIGGGYSVVGPAEGIEGAFEANFDRDSIALTPHVQDFIDWFDAEGCGSEPWVAGQMQDVTEAGCAFVPSFESCPVEYDLVAPGDEALYFGERPIEGDMCSTRTRPSQLGQYAVVLQGA